MFFPLTVMFKRALDASPAPGWRTNACVCLFTKTMPFLLKPLLATRIVCETQSIASAGRCYKISFHSWSFYFHLFPIFMPTKKHIW